MPNSALEYLLSNQVDWQGWGYQQGNAPVVEATAAALLYIKNFPEAKSAVQNSLNWLASIHNIDGGWGINGIDAQSGWQSAWAILALARCQGSSSAIEAGIRWLATVDAMRIQDLEALADGERVAGINFSLRGWPWLPGESSWVEPTAISLIALAFSTNSFDLSEQVDEAVNYLIDRRCPGGGWNVGNPVMFGSLIPARAHPTAWSLIALSHYAPEQILPVDIQVLKQEMIQDGGMLAIAWGLLALRLIGEDYPEAASLLTNTQDENGSWEGNPYLTAVAAMALRGEF